MSKSDDSRHHDSERKTTNYGIAGAFSGMTTRALSQPLDVIKIRFQLQIEPISKKSAESKYKSVLQALKLITKEEGIIGLWRGHIAAQLLSITYGIVQFQTYESLKENFANLNKNSSDHHLENYTVVHFLCGGVAGSFATIFSFPFDMIRTRLIAQGNNKHYKGIFSGLRRIRREEGMFGYWRGITPALIVAGPMIGFQFTFYELTKKGILYLDWYGVDKSKSDTNAVGNFVAGCVAGMCAKLITYPFDLARKRMQIQSFQHARVGFGQNFWCTGLTTCFISTWKQENVFGLYKGLLPSMWKSAATTAFHFMFYAEFLKFLNKYR